MQTAKHYQPNRSVCAWPLFVCFTHPSHPWWAIPQHCASPINREQYLSFSLEHLYKIMQKKIKETFEHQQGEHKCTAIYKHLNSEQTLQQLPRKLFPAGLCKCCSLCRNMQRTGDSPTQISRNVQHKAQHSLNPPSKPVVSSFSSSFYQTAG